MIPAMVAGIVTPMASFSPRLKLDEDVEEDEDDGELFWLVVLVGPGIAAEGLMLVICESRGTLPSKSPEEFQRYEIIQLTISRLPSTCLHRRLIRARHRHHVPQDLRTIL